MSYVKGRSDLRETVAGTARRTRLAAPGATRFTAMGWPIDARGLTEELIHLRNQYGNPDLYVTENGARYDPRAADGAVRDHEYAGFQVILLRVIEPPP
jgi:beta-glucosidase/6-phospho-beta-glucosidase/beta-galactosidase